jgi:predicted nuclease with TOPRIM domain
MKVVKEIIEKLNEINALLEERLDASNMDVEFMMQRVEDMIDEFEEIEEFQFERRRRIKKVNGRVSGVFMAP